MKRRLLAILITVSMVLSMNIPTFAGVTEGPGVAVTAGDEDPWVTIGDTEVVGVERSWLGTKGEDTTPGNPYLLFRGYDTYKDFTAFEQINAASPSGFWPILSQNDKLIPNGNTDKVWRSGAGGAWNTNRVLEIELKQRYDLEEIWFFDGGAYRPSAYWDFTDPNNPVPDVPNDPQGVGSKWEVIGGSINVYGYLEDAQRYELLFSYDMNNTDSWVQVDLSDLSDFTNHTSLTYEEIKRVSKIKIEKVSEDKYHWWQGAEVYRNFDCDVNLSSFVMVGKPISRSMTAAVQRSWLGNDGKAEGDGSPYLLFDGYENYKDFTTFDQISAAAPNGYWPILSNEEKALPKNNSVWRTGEGGSRTLEIALKQKHTLQEIWFFDGAEYGPTSNSIPDQPSEWQVTGGSVRVSAYVDDEYVELFTYAMNNSDSWVRMNLSNPAGFGGSYSYDAIKNASKLKIEKLSGSTYKYKNFADNIITVDCDVNLSELVILGLPLEPLVVDTGKRDIVPIDWEKEPQTVPEFDIDFEKFVGTNAFFNDPDLNSNVVPISGTTREYHTWAWTEYMAGNDWTYGDNDPRMIDDPERPLVAFANIWGGTFDNYYRNMKAAGAEVYLCIQNLQVGDAERTDPSYNMPNYQGDGDRQNPDSYLGHAMSLWQHAARYGSNKSLAEGGTIDPDLVHVAPGTTKEIGLNLIKTYENGNELNLKGVNGYEFAAMTSADYDGHMNSMKSWIHDTDIAVNSRSGNYIYTERATGKPYSGVGIKNADPNAKLSIAGVGGLDLKFLEEMTEWFLTYRTEDDYLDINYVFEGGSYYRTHDTQKNRPYTRAEALLGEENPENQENFLYRFEQFPVDILNVHHYCPDSMDVANGRPIGGVAPEEDQWTKQTWNQDVPLEYGMNWVMNLRALYYPKAEVWISELGWDSAQGTATTAKANQTYYPGVNAQLKLDKNLYPSFPGKDNPATLQNVVGGFEIQGRWIVREFLLLSSWDVDRAQQFMLRGSGTGTAGKFYTSGYLDTQNVLGEGTTAKKPSWYYVATMRNWLSDMRFEREVETPAYTKKVEAWDTSGNAFTNNNTTPENALNVLQFGFDDENIGKDEEDWNNGKGYALWLGTSKGDVNGNYVDYELDLSGIPQADIEDITLVELVHKSEAGSATSIMSQLSDGKVTVRVTEKPVFVTVTTGDNGEPAAHNITIGQIDNGSVTSDKAQATEGELVTLTVAPNPEYKMQPGSLKVNGSAGGLTNLGNNKYLFTMPDEDVTVTISFVRIEPGNEYAVLYDEDFDARDSVGGGAWAGDRAAIVHRPDGVTGDKAVELTQGAGNNLYQLPAISFEPGVDYTLEYDFRGDSGIDGTSFYLNDGQRLFDGDAPVSGMMNLRPWNTWANKTYTHNQWHHFKVQFRHDGVKWSFTLYIDNVLMANGPVTTATATGNLTVKLKNGYASDEGGKAYFDNFFLYKGQQEVVKVPHSITVPGQITRGSVTADKATATEGETVTLTITPDNGYTLSWLRIDGVNQTIDGNSHVFLMPDKDIVVTAEFMVLEVPYEVLYEENYDLRSAPNELAGWAGTGSVIVTAPGGVGGKALEITQTDGNSLYQFPSIAFKAGIDYTLEYDFMGSGTSTGNALYVGWSERFYDSDGGSDPSKLHLRMWQKWITKSYTKDAWHHFKAEFKHNGVKWRIRLFLDGVLVDENDVNGAVSLNKQLMLTVGGAGGKNYFDNVALYQGEKPAVGYTVTVPGAITGGSVTADKAAAAEGETVTLTIAPKTGYRLSWLKIDGVAQTVSGQSFSFTMPGHGVVITAAFESNYTALYLEDFDDSLYTGAWAGDRAAVVTAPGGVGGKAIEITYGAGNNLYQFPAITLAPNVSYTLEYDFMGSGVITGNGLYLGWGARFYDSDGPAQGSDMNLRAWNTWGNKYYTKDQWHHFKVVFTHNGTAWNFTLYLDNVSVATGPCSANVTGSLQMMLRLGATANGGKGYFDNIELYTGEKPAAEYTVTVPDEITGGSVTADKATAAEGESVTLTIAPDAGYTLSWLKIDDIEQTVSGQSFSFTMPAGAVEITAEFEAGVSGGPYVFLDEAVKRTFIQTEAGLINLPYRLYVPEGAESMGPLPVLLFLHGAGEAGTDNEAHVNVNASILYRMTDTYYENYPCIIIAPQTPGNGWGDEQMSKSLWALVESVQNEFDADPSRLYVMGLSLGGWGTWGMLEHYPEKIAAAVPICGWSNDPSAQGVINKDIPIWIFHGDADGTVNVSHSRNVYNELIAAGNTEVKYTEFPGVGHNSWDSAYVYRDPNDGNKNIVEWLFAQTKPAYNVTTSMSANGTVNADRATMIAGGTVTLTVIPENGYKLTPASLKVNGGDVELVSVGNNVFTFVMPAENVTVEAAFESGSPSGEYEVNVDDPFENGSIAADETIAQAGNAITLTVTSNPGYKLKTLTVTLDGYGIKVALTPVGSNKFTFVMPAGDVTVTAEFESAYTVLYHEDFEDSLYTGAWAGDRAAVVTAPGGAGGKAIEITYGAGNNLYQFPAITLEPNVSYTLEYDFRGSGLITGNALYLGWGARFYDSDGPAQGSDMNLRAWNTWVNKYYAKDQWHHFKVEFTHNGTAWNFTLYLDNVSVATGPCGANVTGSVQLMLRLGATVNGGKGYFDNIILYRN